MASLTTAWNISQKYFYEGELSYGFFSLPMWLINQYTLLSLVHSGIFYLLSILLIAFCTCIPIERGSVLHMWGGIVNFRVLKRPTITFPLAIKSYDGHSKNYDEWFEDILHLNEMYARDDIIKTLSLLTKHKNKNTIE